MKIQVNPWPNYLLETADLVCAYVNGIKPQYLTGEGKYCIPAKEMGEIMEKVCGDLDLGTSRVRLFFGGYQLDESGGADSLPVCIACILLNGYDGCDAGDDKKIRTILHESYLGSGKPYTLNSFGKSGFGWDACDEECSIAEELDKLAMPDALRPRVVEVLSAYHKHIDMLCDLLEPLAERLRPLVQPWVEKLQPLFQQWEEALHTEEKLRDFCSRMNINLSGIKEIVMRPRLCYPNSCQGIYTRSREFYCNAGISLCIGQAKKTAPTPLDMTALRQLSNADRVEMLKIMAKQAAGPREIGRKLGINPGTIFRDLNNMVQAHLLKIVVNDSGHSYITDIDYLKSMVQRLVEYIESGE